LKNSSFVCFFSEQTFFIQKLTGLSKIFVFIYGMLAIGVAYLASKLGPLLQAALSILGKKINKIQKNYEILGILGGPLVATFTMGIVLPFTNQAGAISGALSGCLFGWVIYFSSKADPKSTILKNLIPGKDF
jgi:sodium-coupled monocarboxylate transporter 8/12